MKTILCFSFFHAKRIHRNPSTRSNQTHFILQCATPPLFPVIPPWGNTGTNTGTEEMAHFEMICAIVHQLTKDLTPEQIKEQGFADYYVDHTLGLWPQSAGGTPFTATYFQSKGDPITDLTEDLAADAATSQKQHSVIFLP